MADSMRNIDREDREEPEGDAKSKKARTGSRKPKFSSEQLEPRILLSATWADAETGDDIDGATDGADVFDGSNNADIAEAMDGDDDLFGGAGDDYLDGGAGNDTLDGGTGDDVVAGGAGDDVISGGAGSDFLVGGAGTDTLSFENSAGGVTVDLGNETATGEGSDTVIGFENVTGSAHDDTLTGDSEANVIVGDAGADTIDGGAGADTIDGGADDDTVSGGAGDDTITGDVGDDTLDGGAGDDVVTGGVGDDTLTGGAGDDTLAGGAGQDDLRGGDGDDVLDGGVDDDTLDGGAGDDTIIGGLGDDTITGGADTDTVDYSGATGGMNVDLAAGTATGSGTDTLSDVENVTGSDYSDTLSGDAAANVFDGGAGDDALTGGAGDDTLRGGAGDDVIIGGAGADALDGGAGDDTLHGDQSDTIAGGTGSDTVHFDDSTSGVTIDLSTSSVETVLGSSHDDVFAFSAASDGDLFTVDGAGGSNTIDLSTFDRADLTIDAEANTITVDLGGGESFEIDFENINHINVDGVDAAPTIDFDDVVVQETSTVQLHTMGISESDAPLTYSWMQVSGPSVDLTDADTTFPSFDTPELSANTTIRFQVEISDGTDTTIEYVTIGVTADNDTVVVDAGSDQIASEGDSVSLSATAVDPEGKAVVQTWTQVSGPSVNLTDADTLTPSFDAPNLTEETDLVFEIAVSDGENEVTQQVTVTVQAVDDAALVNAGSDQSVDEGASVQLGATAMDPEGETLTYTWTQTSGPAVALTDSDSASPTFTAPEAVTNTTLQFQVEVSDGVNISTDTVAIVVNAVDGAPIFVSTPDLSVGENEVVNLRATATDPEGQGITYSWSQIGGPDISIVNGDTQTPSFTAPEQIANTYVSFNVTASDGTNTTVARIDVLVNADNDAPVVDAGDPASVTAGEYLDLSATAEDPEGNAVSYTWMQIGGPDAQILSPGSATPTIAAPDVDASTELTFQVAVTDGTNTTIDTVVITVDPVDAGGGGDGGGGGGGDGGGGGGGDGGGGGGGGDGGGASDPDPLLVDAPATVDAPEGELATLSVDLVQSTGDVSYGWTQIAGSQTITLDGADTATPTFTVPEHLDNEIYIFEATVEDDSGPRTVQVTLRVVADNDGPEVTTADDASQITDSLYSIDSTASDPEGQNLAYNWVQIGGPDVEIVRGDTSSIVYSTSTLQEAAELTFEVQVSDGTNISTDTVTIMAQPGNTEPVVSVGNDMDVTEGDTVSLTSVASDPDDDPLTYQWEQTGGPTVTLSDSTAAAPTFTAPNLLVDDDITFELTVSDGALTAVDSVTIHVAADNDPPTVDAGTFQEVDEGETVSLSATGTDPEGQGLTYTWTQIGGATVEITDADSASASFTAQEDLTNSYLTFEVEASDGVNTVVDRVMILVNADNDAPGLDAGADFSADEETEVQLSATASDPEGAPLTHTWVQTGGPDVDLSDPTSLDPTFDAPNVLDDTEITFQLTTTDGEHTVVDTITVTITGENDAPEPTDSTTRLTEDTTAAITLAGTDPDLGDSVEQFRIDSVPTDGTLLIDGVTVEVGDTLTVQQISDGALTFEPDADWSGTTSLQFSAFDGDAWSASPGTQSIVVVSDADAPTVTTLDASGTEDTQIELTLEVDLTDIDGSESITGLEVTGAPDGTIFTDGMNTVTAWDGEADLTGFDLDSLRMTPGADHDQDFTLTFTATSTEASGGDTAVGAATLDVHIDAVNDAPVARDGTVTVDEDSAATINLKVLEADTGDSAETFRIESLPGNGTLLLDGIAVEADGEISASDVLSGHLTFEPDADWSGDATFEFSVFDGELWSDDAGTFTISVEGVADAPDVTVSDAFVIEDGTATLDISAVLTDTDGSETIRAITIDGAPIGSVFTDGVNTERALGEPIDITEWDLDNLQITPITNYDQDFDLQVSVTSQETDTGDTSTTDASMTVHVTAVNDASIAEDGAVTVNEDQSATISLTASDADTGDSVESYRLDSLPEHGTMLLNGTPLSAGDTISVAEVDAGNLTFEPDANWSGATTFEFSASDGESWSAETGEYTVNVTAVADDAQLDVSDAAGDEDTAISLDIDPSLMDVDGSESISKIRISGIPEGAVVTDGVNSFTASANTSAVNITSWDLDSLTVTPPEDSGDDFSLKVIARTIESANGDQSWLSDTIDVTVTARVDAPTLDVPASVSGAEDTAIPLGIDANLTDTDGSEMLTITVAGVPDGATLSAGTDNGDGTWTLTGAQADGVTITSPTNSDDNFTLDITATSVESDTGESSAVSTSVAVNVTADADAPTLAVSSATGYEDSPIALSIDTALVDTDGSESLSLTISGVPDGAELSAGTDNGDGTWTLSPGQLDGLTVTPAGDSGGDFMLTVTSTATEGANGDSADSVATINVTVNAVADSVTLATPDAITGAEDTAIALPIDASLTDTDGSETLTITVSNVPDGAELSAGTDNGDGTWTLTANQVDGLTITPPAHSDAEFDLTIEATASEGENNSTASLSSVVSVSVTADADAPALSVSNSWGHEDAPIAISIDTVLVDSDGSESLSVTIAGVPDGAELSAGTDNGDGSWTLAPGQLDDLTIMPAAHDDSDFTLTVTSTATEDANGDTASAAASIDVTVNAVADTPALDAPETVIGAEDTAIPLGISSSLADADGSESLSLTISGVPDGAELSAGTDNGDGTWTLSSGQLDGLTLTPPANSDADFELTVTSEATESSNGDTASAMTTIDVQVTAAADAPMLSVSSANGTEDTAITLSISSALTDTDGTESLSITIDGVPDGAILSAGTDNGDGSWSLTVEQLDGLTITPPEHDGDDFSLEVIATASTDIDGGDTATTVASIDVTVTAVVDAPTLSASNTTGLEDSPIALSIDTALVDIDGSETLTITVSNVPGGAELSAGTDNGDGTWTLTLGQLDGLTITPPADSDADFVLEITATAVESENGDIAIATTSIAVEVEAVADVPELEVTRTVQSIAGTPQPLSIEAQLADRDGSETLTIVISGVPEEITFSAGIDNRDGTWSLTTAELRNLTFEASPEFTDQFEMTVTATTTEGENGASTSTSSKVGMTVVSPLAGGDSDDPVDEIEETTNDSGEIDWSDVGTLEIMDTAQHGVEEIIGAVDLVDDGLSADFTAPDVDVDAMVIDDVQPDGIDFEGEINLPVREGFDVTPDPDWASPLYESEPESYDLTYIEAEEAAKGERSEHELSDRRDEVAEDPTRQSTPARSAFMPALWSLFRSLAPRALEKEEDEEDDRKRRR